MTDQSADQTTEQTYETIESTLMGDGVRVIALNRPERLNAMNPALIRDVARAFDDANADSQTRAIVFTGNGRAFCAGDDRHDHTHPETEQQARALVDAIQRATHAITFGPKPVVGAINGWAVGGGFEWAINCDFPIWGESARAFFPEVSLNLFVTGAVTALLPALVGLQKAREMLFLGQRYTAAELSEAGLAWRVVPDSALRDEAMETARHLAALPPLAVRAMKRTLNANANADLNRALQMETDATVAGFLDPETTRLLKDF
ncbi:MAG: enoyl-CoA hydratase/isomerase family protein [Sediminimonas qiaohouensis]|uniref:Enoyl-CoA hydratase/isomerase family protein n=1 Tax=Sediminimonas qiaohouensis TaxID=552061 RepID=A0A7C9H9Q1_9RHOB|nr:enoyl-CoA hydratase/isomerase family protein [Sediminimonas qiaohouensis]MTJ03626.1 enoyl-CoA hydratase/isomerase family protein [Sediminimonas qiaohouensis]